MIRTVKMLCRVLVLRRIATTDVAAAHAQPEVDPGVAHFKTLFTTMAVRFDILDLVRVSTTFHRVHLA